MQSHKDETVSGRKSGRLGWGRWFYEAELGIPAGTNSGDYVAYRCGEEPVGHVCLSPEHAGETWAILAGGHADDVEADDPGHEGRGHAAFDRRVAAPLLPT